jgi:outer membrane protein assembly factor BamB
VVVASRDAELDLLVLKLSGTNGAELWSASGGTSSRDSPFYAEFDASDDVIIGGGTLGAFGDTAYGSNDFFAIKLDGLDGGEIWRQQIGTAAAELFGGGGLAPGGDVWLAGSTQQAGPGTIRDAYVVGLSGSTGEVLWSRQFGTSEDDGASDVVGDAAGNPVVAGRTDADLGGVPPAGLDDIFVGKIVR